MEFLQSPSGLIPDDIDLLMLLHPKNLSDKQLYQIDQYVLKGGNLFIALDPNARAEAASGDNQQAVLLVICRDYLRAGEFVMIRPK